jgi:parallel beta-helix repeat protein
MRRSAISVFMLTVFLISTLVMAFGFELAKTAPATIIVPDDYPTIQQAIAAANSGDTVYIRTGTYSENVTLFSISPYPPNDILIMGEDESNTVVNGSISFGFYGGVSGYAVRRLQIMGELSFGRNTNCSISDVIVNSGVRVHGSWNMEVANSLIKGGITITSETHYWPSGQICITNNTLLGDGVSVGSWTNAIEVAGNRILNASVGIASDTIYTYGHLFTGNGLSNCGRGMEIACYTFYPGGDFLISKNTFVNNTYGVFLQGQSWLGQNAKLFHNNFMNSPIQNEAVNSSFVWDDGYPSGGNYWSDYAGVDFFNGPFQNESRSDGIGDTPYVVDENNTDHYPLKNQYPFHSVAIADVRPSCHVVRQDFNMSIVVDVQNRGHFAETFSVTLYANAYEIETQTVTGLEPGIEEQMSLDFIWNTVGFSPGDYVISAYADPVPDEVCPDDNSLTYSTPVRIVPITTYIIVEASLHDSLITYLERYLNDLEDTGNYAIVFKFSGNAVELRNILQTAHSKGLRGCVLVGTLPLVWYEMDTDWGHEEFPTDLYYMDLDGSWADTDSDGKYDQHTGNRLPEIWVGRIKASNMAQGEVSLIQTYFDKNHAFRTGALSLAYKGLTYVDDDWAGYSSSLDYAMSLVYSDRTLISSNAQTTAADYLNRLGQSYSFVQVLVHGSSAYHIFKVNGQWDGYVYSSNIRSTDPHAFFYNLFSCSNARYCDTDYIAGWYVFSPSYGLAAISSTKTGGMWFFSDFYREFNQKTLGESFRKWLVNRVAYEDGHPGFWYSSRWYYGMVILGDPTLYKAYQTGDALCQSEANDRPPSPPAVHWPSRLTVSTRSEANTYTSIQEAINAANPGDTIEISAGTYNEQITVNKTVTIVGQNTDSVFVVTNETGPIILVVADGVQIRNLTIKALPVGNLTITQIPIQTGIAIYSGNNRIEKNRIVNCNVGVQLSNSNSNRVEGNTIRNSSQSGIDACESRNNTVADNAISDNLVAAFFLECQNTTFVGNQLTNNTHAAIQYAVADIAVTHIEPFRTVVGQNYSILMDVRASNKGNYSATFSLTLSANETTIETVGNIALTNGSFTTITFDWNTTGFAYGNYTISAYAWPIPGETYSADNTFAYGWITVTIPGDVDGDRDVDIFDIVTIAGDYGKPPPPLDDPNSDIDGDGDVDIFDIVVAADYYGESW